MFINIHRKLEKKGSNFHMKDEKMYYIVSNSQTVLYNRVDGIQRDVNIADDYKVAYI